MKKVSTTINLDSIVEVTLQEEAYERFAEYLNLIYKEDGPRMLELFTVDSPPTTIRTVLGRLFTIAVDMKERNMSNFIEGRELRIVTYKEGHGLNNLLKNTREGVD